jgi:hypothetical protein
MTVSEAGSMGLVRSDGGCGCGPMRSPWGLCRWCAAARLQCDVVRSDVGAQWTWFDGPHSPPFGIVLCGRLLCALVDSAVARGVSSGAQATVCLSGASLLTSPRCVASGASRCRCSWTGCRLLNASAQTGPLCRRPSPCPRSFVLSRVPSGFCLTASCHPKRRAVRGGGAA